MPGLHHQRGAGAGDVLVPAVATELASRQRAVLVAVLLVEGHDGAAQFRICLQPGAEGGRALHAVQPAGWDDKHGVLRKGGGGVEIHGHQAVGLPGQVDQVASLGGKAV